MKCFFLRGAPGAGKSTLAAELAEKYNGVVCEADQYFYHNSKYQFDATKLGPAHQYCRNQFENCLQSRQNVIVSNTSVKRADRKFYQEKALAAGYQFFSIVVENLGSKDIHNVPPEKVQQMRDVLKNNIDL